MGNAVYRLLCTYASRLHLLGILSSPNTAFLSQATGADSQDGVLGSRLEYPFDLSPDGLSRCAFLYSQCPVLIYRLPTQSSYSCMPECMQGAHVSSSLLHVSLVCALVLRLAAAQPVVPCSGRVLTERAQLTFLRAGNSRAGACPSHGPCRTCSQSAL